MLCFILLLILIDIILIAIWLTVSDKLGINVIFAPWYFFSTFLLSEFLINFSFQKVEQNNKIWLDEISFIFIHLSSADSAVCFNFLKLSDVVLNQIWKRKLASFSWNIFLLLYFSLRFHYLTVHWCISPCFELNNFYWTAFKFYDSFNCRSKILLIPTEELKVLEVFFT